MGQISLGHVAHPVNPAIPTTLSPGEPATWVVPLTDIIAAAQAASHARVRFEELRAIVSLGTGKSRRSKRSPLRMSELPARFGLAGARQAP